MFPTRVDIDALISKFMVGHPPSVLFATPRLELRFRDGNGGATHRAPREHSNDHEAYRGSNEPIEQSVDPARSSPPGLLAEYALPFKYLGDALALRNRIIHILEEADIEQDPAV